MFALNGNTVPLQWDLTANDFFVSSFNLGLGGLDIQQLNWIGGYVSGTTHLTGGGNNSSATILGVTHGNDFVIDGTWGGVAAFGQLMLGNRNFIDATAGGDINIINSYTVKINGTMAATCDKGITSETVMVRKGFVTHC
jgi:hypothetical protein